MKTQRETTCSKSYIDAVHGMCDQNEIIFDIQIFLWVIFNTFTIKLCWDGEFLYGSIFLMKTQRETTCSKSYIQWRCTLNVWPEWNYFWHPNIFMGNFQHIHYQALLRWGIFIWQHFLELSPKWGGTTIDCQVRSNLFRLTVKYFAFK